MGDKFLNLGGASRLWTNIKNYIDTALAAKQDTLVSGTNIKTVNSTSLLGSGDIAFPTIDTAMSDSSTNAVQNSTIKAYVDTQDATKQDALSKDTTSPNYYINADVESDTVQLATKAYVDSKDPFMLLDFSQSVSGTLLPATSDTAISGASTGRVDITVPEQYQDEWAIASIAKWEIKNGSTRIDAFPMYSFSMNGQKTMRIGYRTSGSSNKSFTTIAGAMLLKHR